MSFINGRALHYVFKIPNRKQTAFFYRQILGMKVLRHEEFADGCEAACNGLLQNCRTSDYSEQNTIILEDKGNMFHPINALYGIVYLQGNQIILTYRSAVSPYANRWSKTMVGYGPESTHFVIELTYNYGINLYETGNDFFGITINSSEALQRAKEHNWPVLQGNVLEAPGGYKFYINDEPQPTDRDPVQKVTLASTDLDNSIKYWNSILGLTIFEKTDESVLLGFKETEAKLELKKIDNPLNRAKAYGRIAFACPFSQQPEISRKVEENNQTILTPLISLDTPGKATVRVIILADPDGHEICFVDEEGFTQLSEFDPEGEKLLDRYINKDKS